MAKKNTFQDLTDKAAKILSDIVKRIQKTDKRFLLMLIAAVVLVIVIFALIVNGIKANKEDDIPAVSDQQNIVEHTTDEEPPADDFSQGMYVVSTGSDADLNMRLAADRDSDVVAKIPNGTSLEVLFIDDSEVKNEGDFGWGYVEYNGERGWVFMEYMKNR